MTRLVLLLSLLGFVACESFTPTRATVQRGSVGTELFGVICDRIAAQNFPEDLGGAKYRDTCHKDTFGNFAKPETVEATPLGEVGTEKNRIARARLSALANRRSDLIEAFDTVFADKDPSFLASMKGLLTRMSPLYDHEIPNLTRSLANTLRSIDASEDAVAGLTRVMNRDGYRPPTPTGGLLAAVALDLVELEDRRVMDQPVNRGHRHARIGEDVVPARERLVGCDQARSFAGRGRGSRRRSAHGRCRNRCGSCQRRADRRSEPWRRGRARRRHWPGP